MRPDLVRLISFSAAVALCAGKASMDDFEQGWIIASNNHNDDNHNGGDADAIIMRIEKLEGAAASLERSVDELEARLAGILQPKERVAEEAVAETSRGRKLSSSSSQQSARLTFDGSQLIFLDSVNISGSVTADVCMCGQVLTPTPAPTWSAFEDRTADVLDLTTTDADLKGFLGGFTDDTYGYFVPDYDGVTGVRFGKVARVTLSDFSTVDVLDLSTTDADLKGFTDAFTDGTYGYFVPYYNGVIKFGKVARVTLSDFSTVDVLDLSTIDSDLKGFNSGFTDGTYGYFSPYSNVAGANGKVARVALG